VPSGTPITRGREAIAQFWQAAMDTGIRAVALQTMSLVEDGDAAAHEIGTATLTIGPDNRAATTIEVRSRLAPRLYRDLAVGNRHLE
jgi:ketosteroid isomerase-like protein